MAPVYLNPPVASHLTLVKLKEEQHDPQLFLSPQQAADHPTFFNTATTQDQRVTTKLEESKPSDPMVNKVMGHDGLSNDRQASSSSSVQSAVDIHSTADGHNLSFCRKGQDGDYDESASDNNNNNNYNNNNGSSSVKWMSSKIRLMKKMMNSNYSAADSADNKPANYKLQYPIMHENETNNSIRVCSDCNTTTTPLWRSGPRGPKSLCNACGIRQRKAKTSHGSGGGGGGKWCNCCNRCNIGEE